MFFCFIVRKNSSRPHGLIDGAFRNRVGRFRRNPKRSWRRQPKNTKNNAKKVEFAYGKTKALVLLFISSPLLFDLVALGLSLLEKGLSVVAAEEYCVTFGASACQSPFKGVCEGRFFKDGNSSFPLIHV